MPAPPVGARIRRARKLLHLTQQQLAEKVGVSRNTVDSWENDRAYPKRYDVALEQVLGISLNEDAQPPGPLADLKPTDRWEADILADRYLPDEDKRWLIENSRAARLAAVEARRARREQAGGQAGDRSGRGREAG